MTARTLPDSYALEIPAQEGEQVRFVTKCPRCKGKHAIDIPQRYAGTFYAVSVNGWPVIEDHRDTGKHAWIRCECGRSLTNWRAVTGTPNDTPCDARCTNAIGPSCDCSCGGKNHGGGYL